MYLFIHKQLENFLNKLPLTAFSHTCNLLWPVEIFTKGHISIEHSHSHNTGSTQWHDPRLENIQNSDPNEEGK
jgi:hypothetical protein